MQKQHFLSFYSNIFNCLKPVFKNLIANLLKTVLCIVREIPNFYTPYNRMTARRKFWLSIHWVLMHCKCLQAFTGKVHSGKVHSMLVKIIGKHYTEGNYNKITGKIFNCYG